MVNAAISQAEPLRWWQQRRFAALLVIAAAIPLLWPGIAPLVDLPGHMGRYRVELDLANSPLLQRFYDFEWALIGNLGVDLLVVPLSRLIGLEAAVKLIILAIPTGTAAGFLWIAREVHGRIPPTALFAIPLAYNHPLIYGFVNFALSMALAFLAFAFWLRLARLGRLRTRAALFLPISLILWVTHIFGWGMLGLLAFSAECVRQHDRGKGIAAAAVRAAFQCLSLAPPLLLMLAWRSGEVGGQTGDWFNLPVKIEYLTRALRDRWFALDVAAVMVVFALIAYAARSKRVGFSRNLGASAIVLAAVFLLLPRVVFGSNYADMRMVPYLLAMTVLAVRPREAASGRFAGRLALAGLAFIASRTAITTASALTYDRKFDRELTALHHIPRGARVAAFVGKSCREHWAMSRLDHLPALAIVRREAFVNDQWTMAGAQLLRVRHAEAEGFESDPSQLVLPPGCSHPEWRTIDEALARLPRRAFDHVWLIDPPRYDARLERGLTLVWSGGTSRLFAIDPGSSGQDGDQ